MSEKKLNLAILGMSCANCSGNIQKTVSKLKGVKEAKVSFASSEGFFTIDPKKITVEDIKKTINDLGYEVKGESENIDQEQQETLLKTKHLFYISLSFTLLLFVVAFGEIFPSNFEPYIMFSLATVVQFYCGWRFYKQAYNALKHNNYDMNVLVALGTSAAYFYSTFVVFFPEIFPTHLRFIYFDGAAVIITFVLFGKYLEENSRYKASDFLKKLIDLTPQHANLRSMDGQVQTVLAKDLQINDVVIVKTGELIPSDGEIIEGQADINTAMLTGESLPVFKQKGDEVLSGTLNTNGILTLKVSKKSQETVLTKIIDLLKFAQSKEIPISRFADKIANIFVPTVVIIAILTFLVWTFLVGNTQNAILASISVIIISCPCALGLATPMAIVSSVSIGAKEGILIKNPEILEVIKEIKYAIFDKTGTLTKGELSVINTNIKKEYFPLIAAVESYSEHPISKAIVKHIKTSHDNFPKVENVEVKAGKGILATYKDQTIILGNKALLEEHDITISKAHLNFYEESIKQSQGAIFVAMDGDTIGSFVLQDELKVDAKETIDSLKKLDITPVLLSGDNQKTAQNIADELGIKVVYANVLPNEKFEVVEQLQQEAKVMFVGDGINDAPSIKQADIGITLNSGADISKAAGDIILMNNQLLSVVKSIQLSTQTLRTIKQNLFFAFVYNALGIPLAAGVLFPFLGVMLTPAYAGIAMSFSSVTVVLNSLRIKLKKIQ